MVWFKSNERMVKEKLIILGTGIHVYSHPLVSPVSQLLFKILKVHGQVKLS